MKKISPPACCGPRRPRGRPRAFEREAALDAALEVFRAKGFEGTSLSDLTSAMGINPPSLYAAFGGKEDLFLEAVKRYRQKIGESCPFVCEPTARQSMEKLLTDLAREYTEPQHARGCLMVMASTTSATSSPKLQQALAEQRAEGRARIRARLEQGVRDGDVPRDADINALANFYVAVIAGMSLQAREGASRKALLAMIETAMRAFPEPPRTARKEKRAAAAA